MKKWVLKDWMVFSLAVSVFIGIVLFIVPQVDSQSATTTSLLPKSNIPVIVASSSPIATTTPVAAPTKKVVVQPVQPEMTPAEFQAMYQTINYTPPAPQPDYMQQELDREAQERQQLSDMANSYRTQVVDPVLAQQAKIDAAAAQIRQEVQDAGGFATESQIEAMAIQRVKSQ